jgi:anti-anti-sigma factor
LPFGRLDEHGALHYNSSMSTEKLTIERAEGGSPSEQIFRLQGPMVLGSMIALEDALRSADTSTILDLTNVPYLDSAGLGVLTKFCVAHEKNGRRFLLAGVNRRVLSLFEITKLDQMLKVFPTVEAARQSLD